MYNNPPKDRRPLLLRRLFRKMLDKPKSNMCKEALASPMQWLTRFCDNICIIRRKWWARVVKWVSVYGFSLYLFYHRLNQLKHQWLASYQAVMSCEFWASVKSRFPQYSQIKVSPSLFTVKGFPMPVQKQWNWFRNGQVHKRLAKTSHRPTLVMVTIQGQVIIPVNYWHLTSNTP